jgi:very-short-patch-repair endonuclease
VRCLLVLGGVPSPSCNYDVIVDGEWLARADIAWPEYRVIVEYDGIVHLAERQRRHDAARRNLLQDAGWLVIVFTAADLRHPEAMAEMVKSALRRPLLREW